MHPAQTKPFTIVIRVCSWRSALHVLGAQRRSVDDERVGDIAQTASSCASTQVHRSRWEAARHACAAPNSMPFSSQPLSGTQVVQIFADVHEQVLDGAVINSSSSKRAEAALLTSRARRHELGLPAEGAWQLMPPPEVYTTRLSRWSEKSDETGVMVQRQ